MNTISPTSSAPRGSRRAGFLLVALMATLMWFGEVFDQLSGLQLDQYGIAPRDTEGLVGIAASPFLHAGLGHVATNTIPFVMLGFLIALGGALRVALVTAIVALVGGSALLGGFLPQEGISWQAHLFGAIGGLVAGWTLAGRDGRTEQRG
jgi:membrane associated rhomboid family serine protease